MQAGAHCGASCGNRLVPALEWRGAAVLIWNWSKADFSQLARQTARHTAHAVTRSKKQEAGSTKPEAAEHCTTSRKLAVLWSFYGWGAAFCGKRLQAVFMRLAGLFCSARRMNAGCACFAALAQQPLEHFVGLGGVGFAFAGFHDLAYQCVKGFVFACLVLRYVIGVGSDDFVDDGFQSACVVHLL